jgi:26S proteasome regulatory subunit N7
MTTTNATGEDITHPYPNLLVSELTSHLLTPSLANIRASSYTKLIDLIKKDHMAPFYRSLFSSSPASTFSLASLTLSPLSPSSPNLGRKELEGGPLGRMDESLVQELEAENEKVLSEFEKTIEEAEKVEGESEIAEAWRAKAMYLTRIGEKVWPPAPCSSYLPTELVLQFAGTGNHGSTNGVGEECRCRVQD